MAGKKKKNKHSEKGIPKNGKKKTEEKDSLLKIGLYLIVAILMFSKFIMDTIKWITENISKLLEGIITFFKKELKKQ